MDIDVDVKKESQEVKIKQEFKTSQIVFPANISTFFDLTADNLQTGLHTIGNHTEDTGIFLFPKLILNTQYQELLKLSLKQLNHFLEVPSSNIEFLSTSV